MKINTILELSIILESEKFWSVVERSYRGDDVFEEADGDCVDRCLEDKGLLVMYRNRQYKKSIKVIARTKMIADGEPQNIEKLLRKLRKRISLYFGPDLCLEDFVVSEVSLSTDIDVRDRANVQGYLKVLKKMGRIKGFSVVDHDGVDDNSYYRLKGNSRAVDCVFFDLERIMEQHIKNTDLDKCYANELLRECRGILRAEVRLKKTREILAYTNEVDTADQIAALIENDSKIFMDVFARIVPFGAFLKQDKALEMIRKEVHDSALRRRMARLLVLVSQKKSLRLAQKEMNCRNVDVVMQAFAQINLAPVSLSKRLTVKQLTNLYEML